MVTAPSWVTLGSIDQAVRDKAAWITDKLKSQHDKARQAALAETQWCHGGRIPYLGQRIQLSVPGEHDTVWFEGYPHAPINGDILHLPLPPSAQPEHIRKQATLWLQDQAGIVFDERLRFFSQRHGLTPRSWRLSNAATQWGSCSSLGRIALNWRLIHFTPDIIDYVVVHELAHLQEMNHSTRFWQQVRSMLPGFEQQRAALRAFSPRSLPLL